jgi:aspartate/methionine/tyrosine aminotransferase
MADELGRIPGLTINLPDGAFYFFVDVRAFGDSQEIARRLLSERRVIVIPGEAFGPGGAGFLRVSFAATDDDIRTGIRALGEELASRRSPR